VYRSNGTTQCAAVFKNFPDSHIWGRLFQIVFEIFGELVVK
jgi:hypothetical protein